MGDNLLELSRDEQLQRGICKAILKHTTSFIDMPTRHNKDRAVSILSGDSNYYFDHVYDDEDKQHFFFISDRFGSLRINGLIPLFRYYDFLKGRSDSIPFGGILFISKDEMINRYVKFIKRYTESTDKNRFKFFVYDLYQNVEQKDYKYFGFEEEDVCVAMFIVLTDTYQMGLI